MLLPRSVKRMILYLGAGPRTDLEIMERLGVDEAALLNAVTQKPYKDFFHAEHKSSASLLSLTELGWEMLEAIRQENEDRQHQKFDDIRYWITTAIAVAALIRAFF